MHKILVFHESIKDKFSPFVHVLCMQYFDYMTTNIDITGKTWLALEERNIFMGKSFYVCFVYGKSLDAALHLILVGLMALRLIERLRYF